ncbi:hypothetical protein FHX09_004309 [Rhizobium sp. BK538]|nr:hypothetical protein [Rhizobium sp. BK538]
MLSEETRAQIRTMAEKYSQRRSNIIWALDRFPYHRHGLQKPRVRVKAISQHWSLSTASEAGVAGE